MRVKKWSTRSSCLTSAIFSLFGRIEDWGWCLFQVRLVITKSLFYSVYKAVCSVHSTRPQILPSKKFEKNIRFDDLPPSHPPLVQRGWTTFPAFFQRYDDIIHIFSRDACTLSWVTGHPLTVAACPGSLFDLSDIYARKWIYWPPYDGTVVFMAVINAYNFRVICTSYVSRTGESESGNMDLSVVEINVISDLWLLGAAAASAM